MVTKTNGKPSSKPEAAPQTPTTETEPMVTYTRMLSAKMRRKYGNVEIEYSLAEEVEVHSLQHQNEIYDSWTKQLEYHHEQFAAEILPKMNNVVMPKQTNGNDNGESSNGNSLKMYPALKLFVEIKGGKRYYKILTPQGTRWAKYGVNIWDEELTKYGIAELMGNRLEMELQNVSIEVEERERGGAVRKIMGLP